MWCSIGIISNWLPESTVCDLHSLLHYCIVIIQYCNSSRIMLDLLHSLYNLYPYQYPLCNINVTYSIPVWRDYNHVSGGIHSGTDMSTPMSRVHIYDHGQPKWRSGIFFMAIRDFLGKVGGDMGWSRCACRVIMSWLKIIKILNFSILLFSAKDELRASLLW